MRKKYIPLVLLGAAMMVACGKQIPEDIIQPAEMEEILYDYHLSVSLGADLPSMTSAKREALKRYALEKHGVTRAYFDSSMVWYTRHADFLHEIYSKLDKRYTMAESRMKTQINKRSGQISISLSGDSLDVWSDRDIYWLSNAKLTNKVTFNLKADTTFHSYDALALQANFTFLSPDSVPAARAMVGLDIKLKNDSLMSLVAPVDSSGQHTFYLKSKYEGAFDQVTGFIYCTAPDSVNGNVLVSGIRLMRYHHQEGQPLEDPKATEAASADASKDDAAKAKSPKSNELQPKASEPRVSDRKGRSGNEVKKEKIELQMVR